jgi:hypothetical protein
MACLASFIFDKVDCVPSWNPMTQATFMDLFEERDWTARGTKGRRTQTAWERQSCVSWPRGSHTPKEYFFASSQRVSIWEGVASGFRKV